MRSLSVEAVAEALAKSVIKWKNVVAGGVENGSEDCALCALFISRSCRGCPVKTDAEELSGCAGTPFEEWFDHQAEHALETQGSRRSQGYVRKVRCPECQRLAEAELAFLQGLKAAPYVDGYITISVRCPTCNSPDPKRHPAVQSEGEVHVCSDAWHRSAS